MGADCADWTVVSGPLKQVNLPTKGGARRVFLPDGDSGAIKISYQ